MARTEPARFDLRHAVRALALACGALLLANTALEAQGEVWTIRAPLPTARSAVCAVALEGKLYVLGGIDAHGAALATVEVYDPLTDTWSSGPDMLQRHGYLGAAAVLDGRIYVVGGASEGDCASVDAGVEAFDPQTNAWTPRAQPARLRFFMRAEAVGGRLYVFGGGAKCGGGEVGTLDVYDPSSDTWTTGRPCPLGLQFGGVTVLDGVIYAMGGWSALRGNAPNVYAYDPTTNAWTARRALPVATGGVGAGVVGGRVYAVGLPDEKGICNQVARYDPPTDTWTMGERLPESAPPFPPHGAVAAVIDGRIYCLGVGELPPVEAQAALRVLEPPYAHLVAAAPAGLAARVNVPAVLPVEVALAGAQDDGSYPDLWLDLSALGLETPLDLTHQGEGRYLGHLAITPQVNGRWYLPVRMTAPGALPRHLWRVDLQVLPVGDQVLYGDGAGAGWAWRTEGSGSTLDTAVTGAVYRGSTALGVQATGLWKLYCEAGAPLTITGYDSLRLAILPGEGAMASLEVGLNANKRRNLLARVDWTDKRWQQVAIPLDSLLAASDEAITRLAIQGMKGQLYLDEVRLAAAPMPDGGGTAVLEERSAALPQAFSLEQNHPNPFNGATVLSFCLPEASQVELRVYNLAGQRVATLAQGPRAAGSYRTTWDGRDDAGQPLASGVYVYILRAGDRQREARKLLLVR